ncbi:uncharacterized protein LOC126904465 [Daktulosphaira vitifoliae]|uniref:uncharacterized protein LOC126904465 n=1 Tax=Daktulosphaira vitifoliae TaxID=58002 RepID=UPI0021AA8409|nr:uncharacterized protein LOC126904465 [Daktulosphaira vitifoliae]
MYSKVTPSSVTVPGTNSQTTQILIPSQTTLKTQCLLPNNNEAILKLLSPLLSDGSSLNSASPPNTNKGPSSLLTPCLPSTHYLHNSLPSACLTYSSTSAKVSPLNSKSKLDISKCKNQKNSELNILNEASNQYYQPLSSFTTLLSKPYDALNINIAYSNPINLPEFSNSENVSCSVISSEKSTTTSISDPCTDSAISSTSQPWKIIEKCINSLSNTTPPTMSNSAQFINSIATQKNYKNSLESFNVTPSFENQLSSIFSLKIPYDHD